MKRKVPLIITFLFGIFMILQYFVPVRTVGSMAGIFQRWAIIVPPSVRQA